MKWKTARSRSSARTSRMSRLRRKLPLAIVAEVAGRQMQEDFEPILERQIHHLINYAQGIMHIGQRDIAWVRVGKAAVEKGFTLRHLGEILHAKFHQDFGAIFDKVQVKIYTEEEKVKEILDKAREVYQQAGCPDRGHDRRDRGDLLLLHALPVFRPHPCLRHHARSGPGSAAPTTGWTARPPSRSTPPGPTSRCPRAR